jgi:ethanolamine ammonia-lyase small subunit
VSAPDIPPSDIWRALRSTTPARIGLGRTGDALPLSAVLDLQRDHARARDAVHAALDTGRLAAELAPLEVLTVSSAAPNRSAYLRRPDLGRQLAPETVLPAGQGFDVVFVIGDGLSATGVQAGAAALVRACIEQLPELTIGPVVIAQQARVALADEIAERLRARVAVMLIGERPGLSVADSLGLYMTFAPRVGRIDAERNCISNIHGAGGLSADQAAQTLGWLLREALRRGLSGVDLKDDQPQLSSSPSLEGPP